jgi:NAD(P)H-dependent flavin oxidoreductase YrpB (nitropropane dioxygenase family)
MTAMKTALCERLGIDVPIVQAPMGGAVGPALAAAVSNAGGIDSDSPSPRSVSEEARYASVKPRATARRAADPPARQARIPQKRSRLC